MSRQNQLRKDAIILAGGERIITTIPGFLLPKLYINVAIYCRVSTSHAAQEESLEAQIDKFKKMVASNASWKLVDVYADVASGKNTSGRPEFNRLMADCVDGKVDLILTKSITRFGRNTVEILKNIAKTVEEIGIVEKPAKMEGKNMIMFLAPK
jgi:predicted site-specific integrase-resolvase